jgi:hypothetical protein
MKYNIEYFKYTMKHPNLVGGQINFSTKKNNGGDNSGKYSNQCIWISIIDYLNGVLGNNINLDEIRAIGSSNNTSINGTREMFDTTTYYDSLLNVTNSFDLQIHMYTSFRNKNNKMVISKKPNWIIGDNSSSNVISIVSYGAHFELITSIGKRKLYRGFMSSYEDFKFNRDLALGKKINKTSKKVLNEIDNLLEMSNNLNRVIINIEQNIKKITIELNDLESSFIFDEKSASELDEQIQIATISSLQEHKIFLENIINENQKELNEIRENFDEVHKKLNELIN